MKVFNQVWLFYFLFLAIIEPPGPLFQIFTIGTSHSSINISWILSGVTSDMINVSTMNSVSTIIIYITIFLTHALLIVHMYVQ